MASYVSIEEIADGMVLAERLVNNFGQTLLPSGAKLSPKHKNMLKTWNITGVMIKGSNDDDEIINPALLASTKAKIMEKALWRPKNRLEDEIFDMGAIKLINFTTIR